MYFHTRALERLRYIVLSVLLLSTLSAQDASEITLLETAAPTTEGSLIYAFAGDLFRYDLATNSIDLISERKGRHGPFFSPDGALFVTNNWPGNNAGVALWGTREARIITEFSMPNTLISKDLGVKVSPEGTMFSGILNPKPGKEPDLVIMDNTGAVLYRLPGHIIRMKGHAWGSKGSLFFTGEVLQGNQAGLQMLAKVENIQSPQITLIRTFDTNFLNAPDELSISPDERRIAYSYKGNIWMGATTADATDHRVYFKATQSLGIPVFSPDGRSMAMAMRNSNTSLRGDIHIALIPESGSVQLLPDGPSKLAGPYGKLKSARTSGKDTSLGWVN
ncbi:MAG: hypothetical protein KTR29_18940 [Rhodothermaceae bacterium]|nr:hypothetical protein [Rhodothermaceae bacterium]